MPKPQYHQTRTQHATHAVSAPAKILLPALMLLTAVGGCATNPVTGKNEISLVSENWELKTGAQQYVPARQSQGGDYVADPQVQAYVQEVGNKIAKVSDRQLPYEFHVINNSTPNAWALPGGKIAINRGLLTELGSEAELAAVIGHEVVHAAAKHSAQAIQRGTLLQAAVLAAGIATADSEYGRVAAMGANASAALFNAKYGRDAERQSDIFGMNYMSRAGYDPQGAVDLQQTFVELKDGQKSDFLRGLFASHPPSQERLAANRAHSSTLPNGGVSGQARYRAVMARLERSQPAYDAYDEARQAMADNRLTAARELVNQAIKGEPEESHFFALLGDIELAQNDVAKADRAFDRAIALNPDFFYTRLRSGVVNEQRGRLGEAKQQLNRSLALLQTAQAYGALGAIAEREGNLQQAEALYGKAANDTGAAGQTALTSLISLRSQSRPQSLVGLGWNVSAQGTVLVQAANRTPRTLRGVNVQIRVVDGQGRGRNYNQRIASLPPNQAQQLNTRLPAGSGQVQLNVVSIESVGR